MFQKNLCNIQQELSFEVNDDCIDLGLTWLATITQKFPL